jgi:hypothetical protein
MRQLVRISVGLLLVAVLVGCGPKRPKIGVISGKITYNGRPLNGAALLLYPTNDPEGGAITIPVDQDGGYRIADIQPGQYKMAVEGTEGAVQADLKNVSPERLAEAKQMLAPMNTPATIPFPKKYKNPQTSGLQCTVTAKDEKLNLELQD